VNVKTVVTRAASGAQQDSWATYSDELDQYLNELVDTANTQYNGKYIFGGTQTLTKPYTLAADHSAVTANPAGISGDINYAVGEGMTQKVNIDGQTAFNGTQMFDAIIRMRDALKAGNPVSTADADAVTAMIDRVSGANSTAGAILQNLDVVNTHLSQQNIQLTSLLSLEQDTDVAEATLHFKHDETVLEAALATGAQIIPKSLVDFLK
jgi:flagellar hook-associated protein 3 FlgL